LLSTESTNKKFTETIFLKKKEEATLFYVAKQIYFSNRKPLKKLYIDKEFTYNIKPKILHLILL
jgi:hypothetical protein